MKIIKYLSVLLIFLSFGSCADPLEVIPQNSVTFENYFKTEKDLDNLLNSVKNGFRNECAFNAIKPPMCKGIVADKFDGFGVGFTIKLWKDMDFDKAHIPGSMSCDWGSYYRLISGAQVLIENAYRAEIPADRIDFYTGQAHFYQAYVYFLIAQIWGDAPLVTHSRDVEPKVRAPWQEVVQYALNEVEEAIRQLPLYQDMIDMRGGKITSRDTPSKEVAYTLKAFICAWKASLNNEPALFEEAVAAATKVIESPNYSLAANPEEVCVSVLLGGGMTESIFEAPIRDYWNEIRAQGVAFTGAYAMVTFPVRPEDGAGDIIYAEANILYSTADKMYPIVKGLGTDLRRDAYFYELDKRKDNQEAVGCAYPYKFRKVRVEDSGDEVGMFVNFDQNRIFYRLADVILLRAECLARQNKTGLAVLDLQRVRDRAYGKPTPYPLQGVDMGDLRFDIFKERERELIWECGRYFDIIRNGYWKTEVSPAYSRLTEQNIVDGALYLPISSRAQDRNQMALQNKFWLSKW